MEKAVINGENINKNNVTLHTECNGIIAIFRFKLFQNLRRNPFNAILYNVIDILTA